jgi:hypothetical protein
MLATDFDTIDPDDPTQLVDDELDDNPIATRVYLYFSLLRAQRGGRAPRRTRGDDPPSLLPRRNVDASRGDFGPAADFARSSCPHQTTTIRSEHARMDLHYSAGRWVDWLLVRAAVTAGTGERPSGQAGRSSGQPAAG